MKEHARRDAGVEHAITAAGGTIKALADILGLHPKSIGGWPQVPAERVLQIERLVPGTSRHVLRSDLYPREDDNP
jgi:DNA-binding transcriptional regulator YdaS (Cro superfamily)